MNENENQNIQSQIDSILATQSNSSNPQEPAQSVQQPTTPSQPKVNPTQQIPQNFHQNTPQNQPTYSQQQQPQSTTQQQNFMDDTSQMTDEVSKTEQLKQSNSLIYISITVGILLLISAIGIFIFRKSVFGPLSFSDCIEIETSIIVELEPAYCRTQEGEIFYKNRNEALPENTEYVDTFDPKNPPETTLPTGP